MGDKEHAVNRLCDALKQATKELSECTLDVADFKKIFQALSDFSLSLQDILEYSLKGPLSGKEELRRLYTHLVRENSKDLCERLRKYGYRLRGTEVYERVYDEKKKKPRGLVYRILELTRLGKRDEVFFSLLNVFQGNNMSPDLVRAFNPVYPDDLFRVFVYSFISGLLGEESTLGEV